MLQNTSKPKYFLALNNKSLGRGCYQLNAEPAKLVPHPSRQDAFYH